MRVCLDTNVLLQLFGTNAAFGAILSALVAGHIELAVSNEVLLEYEEIVTRLSGAAPWRRVAALLDVLKELHGNIILVEPVFRFGVISIDPDDNKFVDCAIAAGADFVVTEDRHFNPLSNAGYRPQPVSPQTFIREYLKHSTS